MRIGILDQSPIGPGETARDAIAHSLALATSCDQLGYHRFWAAEHHSSDALAGCAPELMIPRIAAATSRLRVGSGGVMLAHYSPFKVAETFRLLELMFPGRIDLGVGRSLGTDGLTAQALAYGNPLGTEHYPSKVKDLVAFTSGEPPFTESFRGIRALPDVPSPPEIWLLGSSYRSARQAARLGLAYCHAHVDGAPQSAIDALRLYRETFSPASIPRPYSSVTVFAIALQRRQRVEALRRQRRAQTITSIYLDPGEAPTPGSIADPGACTTGADSTRDIIGTASEVRDHIEQTVADAGANEAMIITITPSFEERLASYELIAREFGLI